MRILGPCSLPRSRFRGVAIVNALVGLALITMALTVIVQTIAASVRAERRVRERFIAVQWLASSLEILRATGKVSSSDTPGLRNARLTVLRKPIPGMTLQEVTLVASWRVQDGSLRSASLSGVARQNVER